jgi:hypothetical protein
MDKDGRIVVPKLILAILKRDEPNIEGYICEVTLEPLEIIRPFPLTGYLLWL